MRGARCGESDPPELSGDRTVGVEQRVKAPNPTSTPLHSSQVALTIPDPNSLKGSPCS